MKLDLVWVMERKSLEHGLLTSLNLLHDLGG